MTILFNDILENGLRHDSDFSECWLYPIPKKGDLCESKNYRPITCLNLDYKLLTKIMAIRLAKVVSILVNDAQAGFVPGRQILHQTDLVQLVLAHVEEENIEGAIVALDQEKAYVRMSSIISSAEPLVSNRRSRIGP
jgi:hypothetical protein